MQRRQQDHGIQLAELPAGWPAWAVLQSVCCHLRMRWSPFKRAVLLSSGPWGMAAAHLRATPQDSRRQALCSQPVHHSTQRIGSGEARGHRGRCSPSQQPAPSFCAWCCVWSHLHSCIQADKLLCLASSVQFDTGCEPAAHRHFYGKLEHLSRRWPALGEASGYPGARIACDALWQDSSLGLRSALCQRGMNQFKQVCTAELCIHATAVHSMAGSCRPPSS